MDSAESNMFSPRFGELPLEIDVFQAQELLQSEEGAVLLDCREVFERDICRLEPSLFLPLQQVPGELATLESYRQQRLIVYCHGGVRSYHLATWLRSQGFFQAQSMALGIDGWSLYIDPTVPRY
jgi:rhodanese-related sulfurtransferase